MPAPPGSGAARSTRAVIRTSGSGVCQPWPGEDRPSSQSHVPGSVDGSRSAPSGNGQAFRLREVEEREDSPWRECPQLRVLRSPLGAGRSLRAVRMELGPAARRPETRGKALPGWQDGVPRGTRASRLGLQSWKYFLGAPCLLHSMTDGPQPSARPDGFLAWTPASVEVGEGPRVRLWARLRAGG